MDELNLKFDKREFEDFKRRNFQGRLKFIDFLADYIRKTPNKVWSKQQAKLINSQAKGNADSKKTRLKNEK